MTKIICHASDCIFWDEDTCSSEEVTYDPERGCLTYENIEDVLLEDEEEWDDGLLDDEPIEWDDAEDDLLDDDELLDDGWGI